MTNFDPGPEAFAGLAEELRLTIAARKTRYILETHVQPRVRSLLHRPNGDQPTPACPHATGQYVVDWICEGVGLLCPNCAIEHFAAEGPHLDLRHRCCIVCGGTSGLVPLTATVRVVRPVLATGRRRVSGLLETTPIVWECRAHDGFLDTKIELQIS